MKQGIPVALLFLMTACAPQADQTATDAASPRDALAAEVPELAACNEMLAAEGGDAAAGVTRVEGSPGLTMIEVACGSAPGTGAYGYPLSLVAEWAAAEDTPEGDLPRVVQPTQFVERDSSGAFVPAGYVTQAIPIYDDLDGAFVHLLYKYAGAGQCGLLVTYSSEAWRNPFTFIGQARERSCDAEPCEDGSCYDPLTWDPVEVSMP